MSGASFQICVVPKSEFQLINSWTRWHFPLHSNYLSLLLIVITWQVITSCNSTKDELVQEVDNFNQRSIGTSQEAGTAEDQEATRHPPFRYLDHVRSYPTFMFGGSIGSRVATVAFQRN